MNLELCIRSRLWPKLRCSEGAEENRENLGEDSRCSGQERVNAQRYSMQIFCFAQRPDSSWYPLWPAIQCVAIPWLRLIVIVLSLWRPSLFMWDLWSTTWYWSRIFFKYFPFPLSESFQKFSMIIFNYMLFWQEGKEVKSENLPKSSALSDIAEHWTEKYFHFKKKITFIYGTLSELVEVGE